MPKIIFIPLESPEDSKCEVEGGNWAIAVRNFFTDFDLQFDGGEGSPARDPDIIGNVAETLGKALLALVEADTGLGEANYSDMMPENCFQIQVKA